MENEIIEKSLIPFCIQNKHSVMIEKKNLREVLRKLNFIESGAIFYKKFKEIDAYLKVDFQKEKLIYPTDKQFIINGEFTTSFTQKENFVVFECVNRLFEKGYKPEHIELEPKWTVGHGASGGRADVMVKDNSGKSLLIIECKTAGKEFDGEWNKTLINGGQIFSYAKQAGSTQFVALYTSDLVDGDISSNYYLITLKDNKKLLKELADKEPLSYEVAKLLDKEDIYKAWKETYSQDYATKGLFENDIPAYEIGKTKYSLTDLNTINSKDIQGKYHEFATILRQHNVSGRENAFDKLVNLFLCKIVDETNNPNELKFYWKGIAYDNFFDLQDRLQKLYQEGMKRFLGEEVTYIDNESIDLAFRFFKNDPDATKETIKKYFRELKFFTNNDFAFIDVHNEKLFYQNATVLLKIVQMLQDILLKTEDQNQFLGDMFEGFLDQGVKQSEGQFFTPMPIVKFILKSLPLDRIINSSEEIPKVIDYACGAGHFLNEYAKQIQPIIKSRKESKPEIYYDEILGIEKEYRLSKVAKVSAFMYGQDEINIVYADALVKHKAIKEGEYSVLVANPPYSVKGFLETLSKVDRKNYELINSISEKSFSNNNSIETFFIERAKQLMKTDGVAGIIVPVSILTKGKSKSTSTTTNVYVATREILLKYFDIIAIAEFGKGTFGKTGTATVTLFIRRKKENPAPANHYKLRVESWFKGDKAKNGIFEDEHFIKDYCIYQELAFEDYQTLLESKPNKYILEADFFKEYKKQFDKWSEIRNRKKQKTFRALKKDEQDKELKRRFVEYVRENEKDRIYYFVLAKINPQKVIIVKSPSKTAEMKEFLGYEWSNAKGNEGIKYLGGVSIEKIVELEDDVDEGNVSLEDEDKRVLSNIYNLDNINTPLYDPKDEDNPEKINQLIATNFEGGKITIPESLKRYVTISDLTEMINFNKIDFNKLISLTPRTTYGYKTKWNVEKLSKLADINPSKTEIKGLKSNTKISFVEMASVSDNGFIENIEEREYEKVKGGGYTYFKKGDIIIAKITPCMENGKCAIANDIPTEIGFGSSEFHVIRKKKDVKILNEYIFALLNIPDLRQVAEQNMTGSSGHRRVPEDFYNNLKIPFPDISIQKKLVVEYQKIEKQFFDAFATIKQENQLLEELYRNAFSKADKTYKISDDDLFDISIGKRVLKRELSKEGKGIPVFSANVIESFGTIEKSLIENFEKPSVLWGIDGDWMVNVIPKNIPFYPTDHCGVLRIRKDIIHPKFLAWVLESEGNRVQFSRDNRASMDSLREIEIKAPSKLIQDELMLKVEDIEKKIYKARKIIKDNLAKKMAVIDKYLL